MIPEVLWLFLHKYYRCQGPIVSRKVIYRQRSYSPELDLYPVRDFQLRLRNNPLIDSLSSSYWSKSIAISRSPPNKREDPVQIPRRILLHIRCSIMSQRPCSVHFDSISFNDDQSRCSHLGSSSPSPTAVTHTSRHYLVCSYFVSLYQTIRSLAEELSHQFGKSLDEIRLWMRFNEVCRSTESPSN